MATINTIYRVGYVVIFTFLLANRLGYAESVVITKTKSKLQEVEAKIIKLQQILSTAHDKQAVLNVELANTDKKIGAGIQQLNRIQRNLTMKQVKINELQVQVNKANLQLQAQQELLAKHVQTRYKMGEYQPAKWLLNQDTPNDITRLLTFYQYFLQSRQELIVQVKETHHTLKVNQSSLETEIGIQQQLQQEFAVNQKKYQEEKLYHKALIQTLNHDIKAHEQKLEEYKRNKANLSHLLTSLVQQSVIQTQTQYSFMQLRHKLPRPVQSARRSVEKMSQGVVFFGKEGDPVRAVYPGKIVFSDWLKGYGLLLIIDHGQGFMTLYAHNQSLFKQKGNSVYQGEQIATIGHSGGFKENSLYFEVRQRGKAVPPFDWLS